MISFQDSVVHFEQHDFILDNKKIYDLISITGRHAPKPKNIKYF